MPKDTKKKHAGELEPWTWTVAKTDDVSCAQSSKSGRRPALSTGKRPATRGGAKSQLQQTTNGSNSSSSLSGETSAGARIPSSDNSFFTSANNIGIHGGHFTVDSSTSQNRTNLIINLHHGQSSAIVHAHDLAPFSPPTVSGAAHPPLNTYTDVKDSTHTKLKVARQDEKPSRRTSGDKGKSPATDIQPENSSDIYSRHLIVKKRGYPLWNPESNHYLPIEYRRNGIYIGDVGMLTASGSFDYLFNVFLSKDHPFNVGRVPPDFTPLSPRPDFNDIHAQYVFKSNSYVASPGVKRSMNTEDYDSDSCMAFRTSSSDGAILTIPDGALSEDLMNHEQLRQYVGQNIKNWYLYANGPRGRGLSNGDLRIVIGTDKTTAWGMAAFVASAPEENKDLSFKLRRRNKAAPGIKVYGWDMYLGSAEVRAGPDLREVQVLSRGDAERAADPRAYENQCIFVRTLNSTLHDKDWQELMTQLSVPASTDSGEGPTIFNPNSSSTRGSSPTGGANRSQSLDARHINQYGLMNSGVEVHTSVTPTYLSSHPSKALNEEILEACKHTDAQAVITSDFDWISVLTDDDVAIPDDITKRIMASHIFRETEGVLYLSSPTPELALLPNTSRVLLTSPALYDQLYDVNRGMDTTLSGQSSNPQTSTDGRDIDKHEHLIAHIDSATSHNDGSESLSKRHHDVAFSARSDHHGREPLSEQHHGIVLTAKFDTHGSEPLSKRHRAVAFQDSSQQGEEILPQEQEHAKAKIGPACARCKNLKVRCVPKPETESCIRCYTACLECVIPARKIRRKPPKREHLIAQIHEQKEEIEGLLRRLEELEGGSSSQRKGSSKVKAEDGRLSPASTGSSFHESESGNISHQIGGGDSTYPESVEENKAVDEWIGKARESLNEVGAFIGIAKEDLFKSTPALGQTLESAQHQTPTILTRGIITPQEAEILFKIYFENMNISVSLLDPVMYTAQRTFYRSPFLFTVICAIASRFYSPRPDLYNKVMQAAQHAAGMALISGNKNVEMCQAYILLSLYPVPATKLKDERSSLYLSLAIKIATDLNLHLPTTTKPLNEIHAREMLNRTRVWMNCLNLDRSTGSQYGKPPVISPRDYIANHSDRWWESSPYNIQNFDIHICAYNAELKVMAAFIAKIYSDPDHPTGLNREVDFERIATETDDELKSLAEKWFTELDHTDMSDQQNSFRRGLLRLAFSYSRLVALSYAFKHAFGKTDGVDENPFLMRCLKAASDVVDSVVNDICRPEQLHYFLHGPDAPSVSVTFASTFLVKLLQPRFASFLVPETRVEIKTLVQSVIDLLESPAVAVDDRHGPKLYSRFLAKLLAKPMAGINPLSSKPEALPHINQNTYPMTSLSSTAYSFTRSPPATETAMSFDSFTPISSTDALATETAATVAATNTSAQNINDIKMEDFFQPSLSFDDHVVQGLQSLTDPSGWQDISLPGFNWMAQFQQNFGFDLNNGTVYDANMDCNYNPTNQSGSQ